MCRQSIDKQRHVCDLRRRRQCLHFPMCTVLMIVFPLFMSSTCFRASRQAPNFPAENLFYLAWVTLVSQFTYELTAHKGFSWIHSQKHPTIVVVAMVWKAFLFIVFPTLTTLGPEWSSTQWMVHWWVLLGHINLLAHHEGWMDGWMDGIWTETLFMSHCEPWWKSFLDHNLNMVRYKWCKHNNNNSWCSTRTTSM
jgi:uncharacterized membrane protein (DUF485 family)